MKSLQAKMYESAEPVCRYCCGSSVKLQKNTNTIQIYKLKYELNQKKNMVGH